jgi:hypothetical protein
MSSRARSRTAESLVPASGAIPITRSAVAGIFLLGAADLGFEAQLFLAADKLRVASNL